MSRDKWLLKLDCELSTNNLLHELFITFVHVQRENLNCLRKIGKVRKLIYKCQTFRICNIFQSKVNLKSFKLRKLLRKAFFNWIFIERLHIFLINVN